VLLPLESGVFAGLSTVERIGQMANFKELKLRLSYFKNAELVDRAQIHSVTIANLDHSL
jgi:hypothetical protein